MTSWLAGRGLQRVPWVMLFPSLIASAFPRELGSPESEFCIVAHIATNKAVGSKAGISELSDRSVE